MQAIGSYRIASFAKYLTNYGFQPLVISAAVNEKTWFGPMDQETATGDEVVRIRGVQLDALVRRVFGKRVSKVGTRRSDFRSKRLDVFKRFLAFCYDEVLAFPDPEWPWYRMGRNRALHVAKEFEPDILLSSAPPFSSHLMGGHIQHRLKIPWVADYRDLWSLNLVRKRTKFVRRMESYLERRTLKGCSAAATVSEPLARELHELLGIPVNVVTNGFDPAEYEAGIKEPLTEWKDNKINMVHTGLLYPGLRDPSVLFQAIQILYKSGSIREGDLKIWFYGPNVDGIKDMISDYSVGPFVELAGLVPRKEALNCQRQADVLLLLEWADSMAKGLFTGKFFEYLGAGKPILAIGASGGVIEHTLKETGMGVLENDPYRLSKIVQDLIQTKSMKGRGMLHPFDPQALKRYTREYQAGVLGEILNDVLRRTSSLSSRKSRSR